ncbi:hypothetical protein CEE37_09295 [candidate division LCP-89 bacterium B3_LCP]|uniref:Hemolysin n=1 Tax=candidate division LCP-89 bacterium B3_LCP TaxID=2012998 RepID=A0A532UYE6_UNCL8|nr:MAG: hypothetical protein CEE37_09295 [candidate division LCP-89 bacterium B3_LCP]
MDLWLIIIFLILSGFFAGTETVFLSVNRIRLEGFAHRGLTGAKSAQWFLIKPTRFVLTTLVGNNLVNIAFSSVLAVYLIERGVPSVWITPIATITILIFGEIVPKSMGRDLADPASRRVAPLLVVFRIILFPLIVFYGWISSMILTIFGMDRSEIRQLFTRRDLEILIREGAKDGMLKAQQETHITRILQFHSLSAHEVMTPRTEMIALDESATLDDLRQTAISSGFSKIPIYLKDVDHIIGVVYARDLFEKPADLSSIIRPVAFFPDQKRAWRIFRDLRSARQSIAIILDEWGGTSGIVTIEDFIEELTGEIEDEYDQTKFSIQHLSKNRWVISARMEVEEINHRLNLQIPEGDYETLGGYLVETLGRIPKEGETIKIEENSFIIIKATRTKIRVIVLEVSAD